MRLFSTGCMVLLCTVIAQAQPAGWSEPLSLAKQFLGLTDTQSGTILKNNDDYNAFASQKLQRIYQVQSEIAAETAKEQLDAGALGVRYLEIELICRDLKTEASESRNRNIAVLNDVQKTKLDILDQAMKLASTISDAQRGNLLGPIDFAPAGFLGSTSGFWGSTGSVLGVGSVYGCSGTSSIAGFILGPIGSPAPSAPLPGRVSEHADASGAPRDSPKE